MNLKKGVSLLLCWFFYWSFTGQLGANEIHQAMNEGKWDEVAGLIGRLQDRSPERLNEVDPGTGMTPLMRAIEQNKMKVVDSLIQFRGLDVNVVDQKTGKTTDGRSALFVAIEKNNLEAVKRLLQLKNADSTPRVNINHLNAWKNTPLVRALSLGHKEIALEILKQGPNLTLNNQWGSNALIWAARVGDAGILQEILRQTEELGNEEKRKILNEDNIWGSNALLWTVRKDEKELATLLLEHGADKNQRLKNRQDQSLLEVVQDMLQKNPKLKGWPEILSKNHLLESFADCALPSQDQKVFEKLMKEISGVIDYASIPPVKEEIKIGEPTLVTDGRADQDEEIRRLFKGCFPSSAEAPPGRTPYVLVKDARERTVGFFFCQLEGMGANRRIHVGHLCVDKGDPDKQDGQVRNKRVGTHLFQKGLYLCHQHFKAIENRNFPFGLTTVSVSDQDPAHRIFVKAGFKAMAHDGSDSERDDNKIIMERPPFAWEGKGGVVLTLPELKKRIMDDWEKASDKIAFTVALLKEFSAAKKVPWDEADIMQEILTKISSLGENLNEQYRRSESEQKRILEKFEAVIRKATENGKMGDRKDLVRARDEILREGKAMRDQYNETYHQLMRLNDSFAEYFLTSADGRKAKPVAPSKSWPKKLSRNEIVAATEDKVEDKGRDRGGRDAVTSPPLDWRNRKFWGPKMLMSPIGETPVETSPLLETAADQEEGLKKYREYPILGDGSCWLRSLLQAALGEILEDEEKWKDFKQKMTDARANFPFQSWKDNEDGRDLLNDAVEILQVLRSPAKTFAERAHMLGHQTIDRKLNKFFRRVIAAQIQDDVAKGKMVLNEYMKILIEQTGQNLNAWGGFEQIRPFVEYFNLNVHELKVKREGEKATLWMDSYRTDDGPKALSGSAIFSGTPPKVFLLPKEGHYDILVREED